ncbi:MAG: dTMP kinase [Desulfuromonadaceae bacterium]
MALFITFEGVEGCGKSTQVELLAGRLTELRLPVLTTREPGGCPIADGIRKILLDPANTALAPLTELLLYAAARAQHVSEVVLPALEQGRIVICDRFLDATMAYQGFGRGLDAELIRQLNHIATGGLQPDLTLLLDMPPREGLQRATERNRTAALSHEERFEKETLAFHEKVRRGYLDLARQNERFRIIDAHGTVEAVAERIYRVVAEQLAARNEQP